MTTKAINLAEKLSQFSDLWAPRIVAELNEYQIKVVKIEGEFVWHNHADTDEVFLVLSGEMELRFRDDSVTLREGELYVVPKGVDHKPIARELCHVLLIEPRGVVNTGDTVGALTAAQDVWV